MLASARTFAFVLLCSSTLVAPAARAQSAGDSAAAQGLFDQAKALMAAGKASEACPKFEESQRLDPGSGTLVNLALCYERVGRIASAWTTYRDAAAAARTAGNTARERGARERAARLAPKVSKLVIQVPAEVRVPGLVLSRDGTEVGDAEWGVPIPADDGPHQIVAKAPGYEEWHTTASVTGAGSTTTVTVPALGASPAPPEATAPEAAPPAAAATTPSEVAPPPTAQPSSRLGAQRLAGLVVGGVGVVGVGIGSFFGLRAISKKSEADKTCTGTACTTDEGVAAGKAARDAGNVSTIAMVAGGVALAAGVTLWLTAPHEHRAAEVGIGFGNVTLRGTF